LIKDDLHLTVEDAIPATGAYTSEEILGLAVCASPDGSDDPGDLALQLAAKERDIELTFAQQTGSWTEPSHEHPYSTVVLKSLDKSDAHPFTVARGNLKALEKLCKVSALEKERLKASFEEHLSSGFTPVAIAIHRSGDPWRLLGLVPLHAMRDIRHISRAKADFRYFHVWDWPLRVLHWLWVLCIIGLSATGICIAEGWFLNLGDLQNGFQFGSLRFVHYALGWILIVVMMLRVACFFMASNKYQSFRTLFPFSKQEWIDLYITAKDYLFAKSYDGPRYIGHNPLQQWSYTAVYGLFTFMIISGLSLYALYEPTNWFYGLFMPLNDWIGIPYIRLLHLIGMWCFLIFAMIHVYLSILSGNVDRDGTISSMVSGGRWLRKGVRFRDE
jgi:Ni/Fe-hydrogenase b-type cytochrome subunit